MFWLINIWILVYINWRENGYYTNFFFLEENEINVNFVWIKFKWIKFYILLKSII